MSCVCCARACVCVCSLHYHRRASQQLTKCTDVSHCGHKNVALSLFTPPAPPPISYHTIRPLSHCLLVMLRLGDRMFSNPIEQKTITPRPVRRRGVRGPLRGDVRGAVQGLHLLQAGDEALPRPAGEGTGGREPSKDSDARLNRFFFFFFWSRAKQPEVFLVCLYIFKT